MKNRMKQFKTGFAAITASLLLTGCRTETARPVPPVTSELEIDYASSIWFKKISFNVLPAENGFVQARAEIQNQDSSAHPYHYRSEWFSEGGELVGESNWQMRVARPEETFVVSVMALHPSATKIKIYVK